MPLGQTFVAFNPFVSNLISLLPKVPLMMRRVDEGKSLTYEQIRRSKVLTIEVSDEQRSLLI